MRTLLLIGITATICAVSFSGCFIKQIEIKELKHNANYITATAKYILNRHITTYNVDDKSNLYLQKRLKEMGCQEVLVTGGQVSIFPDSLVIFKKRKKLRSTLIAYDFRKVNNDVKIKGNGFIKVSEKLFYKRDPISISANKPCNNQTIAYTRP